MFEVPRTVPLHITRIWVLKYVSGDAVNVVGGVGKIFRLAGFDSAHVLYSGDPAEPRV
ncbi:hypothetical protein FACS1894184_21040 [Clostridia bacterium]|nr:hypothetical protein FACS1894184_21040 [Clostridia bacterium]GHU79284.1 hypothetical protein AGMMS49992_31060 [Clostridia bacterium]